MLTNPYFLVVLTALATALLAMLYARSTETDPKAANKTFYKTLACGLLAGAGVTYAATAWLGGGEDTLSAGGGGGGMDRPPAQPFMEVGM